MVPDEDHALFFRCILIRMVYGLLVSLSSIQHPGTSGNGRMILFYFIAFCGNEKIIKRHAFKKKPGTVVQKGRIRSKMNQHLCPLTEFFYGTWRQHYSFVDPNDLVL